MTGGSMWDEVGPMEGLIAVGLVVGLGAWLLVALLGCYVACAKGRPGVEGFAFGVFLGPLGVLIVALLPTVPRATWEPPAKPAGKPKPEPNDPGVRAWVLPEWDDDWDKR